MFEPFFSTKEVGKGSGMGLAMVHGIVHEYGGHIQVDTGPAEGATIRVWFPAWFAPERVSGVTGGLAAAAGGVQKTRVISAAAFCWPRTSPRCGSSWAICSAVGDFPSPCPAENGVRPASNLQKDPDGFDLIVLDQTMPRMTGLEAAEDMAGCAQTSPRSSTRGTAST